MVYTQCSAVDKIAGSGISVPGFESWLPWEIAVWPWVKFIFFLRNKSNLLSIYYVQW